MGDGEFDAITGRAAYLIFRVREQGVLPIGQVVINAMCEGMGHAALILGRCNNLHFVFQTQRIGQYGQNGAVYAIVVGDNYLHSEGGKVGFCSLKIKSIQSYLQRLKSRNFNGLFQAGKPTGIRFSEGICTSGDIS
jgi:hypothetical protein